MLKIGITGGIGSGKSTVAQIFEVLGIPVYYADQAARVLMNENPHLREQIIQAFGPEAYSNGQLNRQYLASQVFTVKARLDQLNALVHPATIADGAQWMKQQTTPYSLKEAAIIFETGSQQYLDAVIGVFAPPALRIQRVMQRDGLSREAVLARISQQMDENIKMRLCDYVIYNDEQQLLLPQVLQLHETLLERAKSNT